MWLCMPTSKWILWSLYIQQLTTLCIWNSMFFWKKKNRKNHWLHGIFYRQEVKQTFFLHWLALTDGVIAGCICSHSCGMAHHFSRLFLSCCAPRLSVSKHQIGGGMEAFKATIESKSNSVQEKSAVHLQRMSPLNQDEPVQCLFLTNHYKCIVSKSFLFLHHILAEEANMCDGELIHTTIIMLPFVL